MAREEEKTPLMREGVCGFGGLTVEHLEGKAPRYSVLPVPYDFTTTYVSGARRGPAAVIEASSHMELYDEELESEPWREGIETLEPVEPTSAGPEDMVRRVEAVVNEIVSDDKVPVVLGGEHSITLGTVRALLRKYPSMSVLQLDAHADMRDSYLDSPFNHACVARRISELCPLAQVGIRSLSREEADHLGRGRRARRGSPEVATRYAPETLEAIASGKAHRLLRGLTDEVFVTVDLDVFDPSVMPATGTPEPGGLGWYQVLAVLREAFSRYNVVGFDVTELAPMPGNVAPDFLAARLVYRMMGYMNRAMDGGRGSRRRGD